MRHTNKLMNENYLRPPYNATQWVAFVINIYVLMQDLK